MGGRVLIVEDEVINAIALAEVIPRWGFEVVEMATSGEDAIRIAKAEAPDIVLMDINIHGPIDGLGAAREIIGGLGIPVIFMTGYDDDETIRAARELKPHDFLVKPLDVNLLRETLRSVSPPGRGGAPAAKGPASGG